MQLDIEFDIEANKSVMILIVYISKAVKFSSYLFTKAFLLYVVYHLSNIEPFFQTPFFQYPHICKN